MAIEKLFGTRAQRAFMITSVLRSPPSLGLLPY
jgi:hypothetical protein